MQTQNERKSTRLASFFSRGISGTKVPYSDKVSPLFFPLLGGAAEAFTAAQLERGFRTLDFYKSLQPMENPSK